MKRLQQWAGALKRDTLAVYYAARDPRTPAAAKLLAAAVVAYAFSPVDLVPDFIPVLGLLDDLLLVPLGLWLAMRWIPPQVLAECRAQAAEAVERPNSRIAAAVIVLAWIAAAALAGWLLYR